jgi:hypothetical protein
MYSHSNKNARAEYIQLHKRQLISKDELDKAVKIVKEKHIAP